MSNVNSVLLKLEFVFESNGPLMAIICQRFGSLFCSLRENMGNERMERKFPNVHIFSFILLLHSKQPSIHLYPKAL